MDEQSNAAQKMQVDMRLKLDEKIHRTIKKAMLEVIQLKVQEMEERLHQRIDVFDWRMQQRIDEIVEVSDAAVERHKNGRIWHGREAEAEDGPKV
jgi:hypothetical protein